jgi:hypothetical protein
VGAQLAQIGQGGLSQALGAAGTGLTAAGAPQDLYNKYASVIFGTPQSSYGMGPTGSSSNTTQSNIGFKI